MMVIYLVHVGKFELVMEDIIGKIEICFNLKGNIIITTILLNCLEKNPVCFITRVKSNTRKYGFIKELVGLTKLCYTVLARG